ncbi:hypothetical protein ACF073_23505 [Streptomyces sp. NPDC015171]|uniref:hypothetical protein n=1 Tax=Streptomyces sp. NPDC015171 TaxID=3364945 RepID=UPI0037020B76
MGLFDKLTGTRRPSEGVAPRSADEVRAVLLGLNQPEVPYVIRYGAAHQADLVAEWRITEPAWQTLFIQSQLTHTVRIRMRLVQRDHEVRTVEEQHEVSRVGNPPRLQIASEYSRGPDRTVTRQWTIGRGDSGRLSARETFRFDSADLRDPLREAVLKSGWTWRGVLLGKL